MNEVSQDKKSKKSYITIQEAAFQSIIERIDKTAIARAEKKYKELESKVENLSQDTKRVDKLLWIVVAVLFIGFATLLAQVGGIVLDTWRFKAGIDQSLIQSLEKQSALLEKNFTATNKQNRLMEEFSEVFRNFNKDEDKN